MFTMVSKNTRMAVSAAAAVAIVSFGALVMDQAYLAAAPRGTVQVGELRPIDAGMTRLAQLPEVVVRGKREFGSHYAAATQLPEVVVVAKRIAHMVAKDEGKAEHGASPAINAGF
jgi:hypothetical protein